MADKCERCGSPGEPITSGPFAGATHPLDYCAECGVDLCRKCMEAGCCGNVPAKSGMADDYPDDD